MRLCDVATNRKEHAVARLALIPPMLMNSAISLSTLVAMFHDIQSQLEEGKIKELKWQINKAIETYKITFKKDFGIDVDMFQRLIQRFEGREDYVEVFNNLISKLDERGDTNQDEGS